MRLERYIKGTSNFDGKKILVLEFCKQDWGTENSSIHLAYQC